MIPPGCNVRCPMGPGGGLTVWKMVLARGVSLPTCEHSIWPAIARMRRSPASAHAVRFFLLRLDGLRLAYLCGDDVELEFLPIIVGLFKCLNLIRIRPSNVGCNKRNATTHVSFRPRSHAFSQSLEAHLQGGHLVRFAQIGLESDGNVFPR